MPDLSSAVQCSSRLVVEACGGACDSNAAWLQMLRCQSLSCKSSLEGRSLPLSPNLAASEEHGEVPVRCYEPGGTHRLRLWTWLSSAVLYCTAHDGVSWHIDFCKFCFQVLALNVHHQSEGRTLCMLQNKLVHLCIDNSCDLHLLSEKSSWSNVVLDS